jgi:hypothetical protein
VCAGILRDQARRHDGAQPESWPEELKATERFAGARFRALTPDAAGQDPCYSNYRRLELPTLYSGGQTALDIIVSAVSALCVQNSCGPLNIKWGKSLSPQRILVILKITIKVVAGACC